MAEDWKEKKANKNGRRKWIRRGGGDDDGGKHFFLASTVPISFSATEIESKTHTHTRAPLVGKN